MKKILTYEGYCVFTASNGREAIEKLQSLYVDLIILDMHMPVMNGLEFLKLIRKKNYTNKPVLMVSGTQDADLRIASYRLGAYDFITKPEQIEVMVKRIENGIKIGEIIDFNEYMKAELFMAKKLQKYIFPDPDFISSQLDVYSWSLPLSDIGGDLYDYIHFRNDTLIFCVADVSGHSISASMITAIVNMVFRNALKITEDPGDILTIVNHELSANLPVESFVTMFCGLVDNNTGTLKYANAGHPAPFIIKGNRIKVLTDTDPFLGPIKDSRYTTHDTRLNSGDMLFIYTDGLEDIIDKSFNQLNVRRLVEKLKNVQPGDRAQFTALTDEISSDEYIRSDDCTIMMITKK
jgi:serine phosphatase RsbU (regulator of sigma subunit)